MNQIVDDEIIPIIKPYSETHTVGQKVLVLNQDYSALSVAHVPRALSLLARGRAELLHIGVEPIRTPSCSIDRPSVIRLFEYIKRPRPRARFTRHQIFKRDGYQCQYCGKRPKELTVDHVIPLSRGGLDCWTNVASSCRACNQRKGARTPQEAHMTLLRTPSEPAVSSYLHLLGIDNRPEWQSFLAA